MLKVFLGSAIWRQVEVAHAQSLAELAVAAHTHGVQLLTSPARGDALVSRARSRVASRFLGTDADVLLTIDGDIVFHPSAALRLCLLAEEYDLVGACYNTRSTPPNVAVNLPLDQQVTFAKDSAPVPVPYVSSGFMAIHRRVFAKLRDTLPLCQNKSPDPFWPFYMPFVAEHEGETIYLSEDWALCQRAREAGFGVWLDPTIRLGHVGDTLYTLEDLLCAPKPPPADLTLERTSGGVLKVSYPMEVAPV